METTKNKLTDHETYFLKSLSNYLGTNFLFFGSVQRNDYFPGKSDIDVDIFTENEKSIMIKMQHFLKVPRSSFEKIVWKLNVKDQTVRGYKVKYKNPEKNIRVEFSIYNEKYKDGVLKEHLKKTILPFYATWLLIIIKFLFYNLKIIPKELYIYTKNKILSLVIGLPENDFVVLDENPDEKYTSHFVEYD
jgi:hypothetical protein